MDRLHLITVYIAVAEEHDLLSETERLCLLFKRYLLRAISHDCEESFSFTRELSKTANEELVILLRNKARYI